MLVISALMGFISIKFGCLKDQDLSIVYNQTASTNRTVVTETNCALFCARDVMCAAFSFHDGGQDPMQSVCRLASKVTGNTFARPGWKVSYKLRQEGRYYGCFADAAPRFLGGMPEVRDDFLTRMKCIQMCRSNGFAFAGPQAGVFCMCATSLGFEPKEIASANCNVKCGGNQSETCGGDWFELDLFETGLVA